MKKIRFLMMLALLVAGASGVYADTYRTYTVEYVGVPQGETGDYQVTAMWTNTGSYYGNYVICAKNEKRNSTQFIMRHYYLQYINSYSSYNAGNSFYAHPEYNIVPKQIEGYDVKVTTRTESGWWEDDYYITITYTPTTATKWNDGIFEYSTRHTQSTGDVQDLPANEVSISLWMGRNDNQYETITDMVTTWGRLWDHDVDATNATSTLYDFGNKDVTATAEYKYIGYKGNRSGTGIFFYERTHKVPISTVTEVEIPREVTHNGTTYQVTAIQKWGFSYAASDCNPRYVCDDDEYSQWVGKDEDYLIENNLAIYDYGNINDHRNDYLVTVRFESPSNVKQIGDYAFMSNKKLQSIIVPNTVENLGQGVWECCQALTDIRFQTNTVTNADGTTSEVVKFNTIKNFTFWYCTALETLILPEGITTIEGTAIGAPLQYMFSLIDLKLPNSLKTIGMHFVCCCTSLETLTIPAGVETIDGACFHGCESLESVYLLGPANVLQASAGEGDNTFGENAVFCRDHVSGCTFYTTADYVDSYAANNVWSLIADNVDGQGYLIDNDGNRIKDSQGNYVRPKSGAGYGNKLMVLTGEYRLFEDGKWITCCFPMPIADYKTEDVFGSKAIAAVMIDGVDDEGKPYTYAVNNNPYYYHIAFQEIETSYIPANTPILLLPRHAETTDGKTYIEMLPNVHMLSEEQKANLTVPHTKTVEASFTNMSETATVKMIGKYMRQRMNPGDFYFKSSGNVTPEGGEPVEIGQFKKVVDQDKAPYINPFRCYWQVDIDNVRDITGSKMGMLFHAKRNDSIVSEDGGFTDGINQMENDVKIDVDIYDVNGRKIDVKQESLPKGMYIVNGKKVVVK